MKVIDFSAKKSTRSLNGGGSTSGGKVQMFVEGFHGFDFNITFDSGFFNGVSLGHNSLNISLLGGGEPFEQSIYSFLENHKNDHPSLKAFYEAYSLGKLSTYNPDSSPNSGSENTLSSSASSASSDSCVVVRLGSTVQKLDNVVKKIRAEENDSATTLGDNHKKKPLVISNVTCVGFNVSDLASSSSQIQPVVNQDSPRFSTVEQLYQHIAGCFYPGGKHLMNLGVATSKGQGEIRTKISRFFCADSVGNQKQLNDLQIIMKRQGPITPACLVSHELPKPSLRHGLK